MNKIRITHRYTRNFSIFGVETAYSFSELNQVCSYLQDLRYGLPLFRTVDEDLGEEEVVNLLSQLYSCQKIVSDEPLIWDGEIDLYDNWHIHVGVKERQELNRKYAKPGVRVAIIEQMLIQARENAVDEEGKEIVAQLKYLKSGQFVPIDWGLKICSGDIYEGSISTGEKIDVLESKEPERKKLLGFSDRVYGVLVILVVISHLTLNLIIPHFFVIGEPYPFRDYSPCLGVGFLSC